MTPADDLGRVGRLGLLTIIADLRAQDARWHRARTVEIERAEAVAASLRAQICQLEEELAAERGVTDELSRRVAELDASNTMACEKPCGDCAGCLYAATVHDQEY